MMTRKGQPTRTSGRPTTGRDQPVAGPTEETGDVARAREQLEPGGGAPPSGSYRLRLYVAGLTPRSTQAVERVREICEENLKGRYELEVVDIYQVPALAKGDQIIATPTLVRVLPAPLRRYIGHLSKEKLIFGLDLRALR